jgi:hypothetical protein
MAFSEGDGYCHGSSVRLRAHTPPPGILYDPNMVEAQNEQRKLLPKRLQEHGSAPSTALVHAAFNTR